MLTVSVHTRAHLAQTARPSSRESLGKTLNLSFQTKRAGGQDIKKLRNLNYSRGELALQNPLDSWDFISASVLAECHRCLTTQSGAWHDHGSLTTCHSCFIELRR